MTGHSSQGSGSLTRDPASSAGLGKVVTSSSATSNKEALNRYHSLGEVQDTCEDSGWCHRVSLVEPPIVWYTAGGPRPVPLLCHASTTQLSLGPQILVGDSGRKSL